VTAIKSVKRKTTALPFPNRTAAAKGADRPADTCDEVMGLGYVWNLGLSVRATAARPRVVANPNGMANQAIPPMM
jgi:hypothetical protein